MFTALLEAARSQQPLAVSLRRQIHAEPEVGNDLPLTRDKVLTALEGLPLDIRLNQTTSGIVAVLGGGRKGPAIILRGDMDGLPMAEDTGLEFSSRSDTMHACGHDLHTAMLVGAARLLVDRADDLAGPVVFMFQPGEEGHHGARCMLDEGLLDVVTPRPTGAFALHVSAAYESGTVRHRPGTQMAAADEVTIVVRGRGGHASSPYLALDPIAVAAEIVLATQTAITRRVSVFDPAVVTFGSIDAGTTHNVIPETATLIGTVRSLSEDTRAEVHGLLKQVTAGIAAAHGATATVEISPGYPVSVNDGAFSARVTEIATDLVGEAAVVPLETPIMGAEDWSYVLSRVPGVMAFLGACPPELEPGEAPGNHSNLVQFDEDAMVAGMALLAAVALDHSGKPPVEPG
jgi:hippurate hydrolase